MPFESLLLDQQDSVQEELISVSRLSHLAHSSSMALELDIGGKLDKIRSGMEKLGNSNATSADQLNLPLGISISNQIADIRKILIRLESSTSSTDSASGT